jgi:N-acetylmuramic acid 6-phosphate etherase
VRGQTILQQAAGVELEIAAQALKSSGDRVELALIMLKTGLNRRQAEQRLKKARGNVRKAIEQM